MLDRDDLGVYVIRACNYIAPLCPISGVGLGGLPPSSYPTLGTGLDDISLCSGYFGLEWAAPDERRLPVTPCSDASTTYDRSRHPSFRSFYRRTLSRLHKFSLGMPPFAPPPLWPTHAKRSNGSDKQRPIAIGLPHDRPQGVRHVRRSSASSEGPALIVTASALGPPRLRDPTWLPCLAPPNTGPQPPSWTTRRPQRPSFCKPLPRITRPALQLNTSQTLLELQLP